MLNLNETAQALQGELAADGSLEFVRVTTDSRDVKPGDLFIALRGDNFDGHAFVTQALAAGAVAAVVETPGPGNRIIVEDTLVSLGLLAKFWRQRFAQTRVVAITGSNGKTTVKEMLAAILSAHAGADQVHATRGNLNNHIGLPLTLLGMREGCRFVVAEMGMNHFGEISYLTHIARPDIAVITNAGNAHLEMLGSVSGVARAKGEIFEGLQADGCAIINADDAQASIWKRAAEGHRQISFGLGQADLCASELSIGEQETRFILNSHQGSLPLTLAVPGVHNVRNALAAAAVACELGIPLTTIVQALANYRGVKGRLERKQAFNGACLIDDTYNANPDSMKAAVDVLSGMRGRKFLVLGDMGEVGSDAPERHAEIGAYAKEKGIDSLFAVGEHMAQACSSFAAGRHFASQDELAAALRAALPADAVVLVKGSRFMQMERVVKALQETI